MNFKGLCSFCFSDVNNENAKLITDTTIENLDLLLINLDLGDRIDHVICNVCLERLLAALEFKSTCKYTDAIIIPYVDWEKPTQLDLWDIYLQEKDNKQSVTLSEDEQVCRLCMELTGKMHVPLQDIDKDEFQKFLPEIDVNIVKDPIVCQTCFDSFSAHSNFLNKLKNCIDQNEAIKGSVCSRNMNPVDDLFPNKMEEVDTKLEDKPSIYSCMPSVQIKSEIEDIKTEFEYDQTSTESLASEIHPVAFESNQQTNQTVTSRCKSKYGVCHNNDDITQNDSLKMKLYKDPSQVQVYKCDHCDYETNTKKNLKSHEVLHKDPSEIQMHKCEFCHYEAKFKYRLKKHLMVHKDPSQVQMHKCDFCTYETKYKYKLNYHHLVHKDPSEVQMYKCATCDYETKFKRLLKSHLLKHKDPSKVQMYKCPTCDYETKLKRVLISHVLKHKDPSEVQMFKCAKCSYESRIKCNLLRHCSSLHRNSS